MISSVAVSGPAARARALWGHRDVSAVDGMLEALMPRHGVVLLRIER
jgi:hypothetical protein